MEAKYGIKVGQIYTPADGRNGKLIVKDVDTFSKCADVVVYDTIAKKERRIDAFKLAMVRYKLASSADETMGLSDADSL